MRFDKKRLRKYGPIVLFCAALVLPGVSGAAARGWQDPDVNRAEVANFDAFLDAHPDIDRDLRANPSLINSSQYVQTHEQLRLYLNSHPRIAEEIKEDSNFFMRREQRFDARERRDTDADGKANAQNPNPDLRNRDLARMDQFLDQHPDVDRDLSRNPSLINNPDYLRDHPLLARYLDENPAMKEEFKENPNYFMRREQRFDSRETDRDRTDRDRDRNATAGNPNPDLRNRDLARMDQFLDQHPDVDRDLSRNPSLINNPDYLRDHPLLARYLDENPAMKEEFRENPNYFMRREQRFDAREDRRDRESGRDRDADRRNPNPDLTRGEVASMDQFLDDHKQIDKDLEKNPTLINNDKYLSKHKDLRNFLQTHPAVREEFRENPGNFMHREERFDARGDRLDRDRNADRDREGAGSDVDVNRQELQQMDNFLDKHKKIAQDLEKNPSLATDSHYLNKHKDLRSFLSSNPRISEELRENPARFMQDEHRFDQKVRTNHAGVKPKTKVEQHEETHPPQHP